ncbi:hypothetical protein LEMLEM_LOCUS17328 [Lemmus lemmus]
MNIAKKENLEDRALFLSCHITLSDRVSLYSPGWPGIDYVDQADLQFTRILPSHI